MSLNWREIDAILEEILLENTLIRDVYQPSHPQLVFELYKPGRRFKMLFSFANPTCRLHLLSPSRKIAKPAKAQRFVSFLRAHVRGGRIVSAAQVDSQRIVRIEVKRADRIVLLWCRLWAAAANLVVTDPDGTILDALYRRPKRGEVSGGTYSVERDISGSRLQPTSSGTGTVGSAEKDRFAIRDLPGPGSFNERVERHYFALEEEREIVKLRSKLLTRLRREENRMLASNQSIEKRMEKYREAENLKIWGDLILANIHTLKRGDRWLTAADNLDPEITWDIELDPQISPARNAETYYRRYRKAKTGLKSISEERQQNQRRLQSIRNRLEALEEGQGNLDSLRQELRGRVTRGRENKQGPAPGLAFTSGAFSILVGRNARENDALLRRHVRGNDTWLHARDYPGGYVFIRSLPGRSVPLDTLLDAANLALHYSKAKDSKAADVFYTQVKYLKRAKNAKTGLVIPTQEKNLHVKLEPARIRRLQQQNTFY